MRPLVHRDVSGLNLVMAAIVLWNTVYLKRVIEVLRGSGQEVDEQLLKHLSPLGWEHINLMGDYVWKQHTDCQTVTATTFEDVS